jgi:hypothetical protein
MTTILAWFNPERWIILALIVLLPAGYFSWRSHERGIGAAPYIEAIKKQNEEAAKLLKVKTDEANAATQALKDFHIAQEKTDAINDQAISILADKLHATRLRDPGATRCSSNPAQGPNTANASSSAADGAQDSGLLSERASDFLRAQAFQADRINLAYISCRQSLQKLSDPESLFIN